MTNDPEVPLPADDERASTWGSPPAALLATMVLRAGRIARMFSLALLLIPAVLVTAMVIVGVVRGHNAATFAIVAGTLLGAALTRYGVLRHRTIRAVSQRENLTTELKALTKAGERGKVTELSAAMRESATLRYLVPPRINATGLWTMIAVATIPLSALLLLIVASMKVVAN